VAENIIRRPEVEKKTGASRTTIYDWTNPQSKRYDPTFPRPIRLGARSVGWLESKIDEWIVRRAQESRANDPAMSQHYRDLAIKSVASRQRQAEDAENGSN
jgi:prophage regulatory protein